MPAFDGTQASQTAGGAPTTWAEMMQYYTGPDAIQGDSGGGGIGGTGTQQAQTVNIPGIGTVQFGTDGQGNIYAQRGNADGTVTTYGSGGASGAIAQKTAKPESNWQSILGDIKGIAPVALAAVGGEFAAGGFGGQAAGMGEGWSGASGVVDPTVSAVGDTAGAASTLSGVVDSTAGAVPGATGDMPYGNLAAASGGTGAMDMTGAAGTGIPGSVAPAVLPGIQSFNIGPGQTAAAAAAAAEASSGSSPMNVGTGSGPGSGTGTGSGSGSGSGPNLNSTLGISSLIPGLAMIGSVAAGNKGADTSNLTGIADTLKANAGTTKPDTSGLTADAAALTGPNSTEALLTSQAQSLIPSVSTGNLPPGAQTLVHNALNDATNSIKSKYAQLGLTGSTMESQELAQANSNAQAQAFQYGQQLTNTGIAEAGAASADINSAANIQSQIISSGLAAAGLSATDLSQSAAIYDEIMKTQVAQDTALQQALANFASASAIGIGLAAGGGGSGSNSSGIVNSLSGLGTGFSNLLSSIGTGASNLFSSATA